VEKENVNMAGGTAIACRPSFLKSEENAEL
jgi:hypothetical protein